MTILSACSTARESASIPTQVTLPPARLDTISATRSAPEAIVQLLVEERRAIRSHDVETLETLWTDDARIIDGRGTPNRDDDYLWRGKPAILDRYVVAVFINPPPLISAADIPTETLEIHTGQTFATLQSGVDSWIFQRQNQAWRIHQLTYSRP